MSVAKIEIIILIVTLDKLCREPPVRQHLTNVYGCLALSTVVAGVGAYIDMVADLSSISFLAAIIGIGLLITLTSTRDNGKNRQMRLGLLLGFSFCSGNFYVSQYFIIWFQFATRYNLNIQVS